MTTTQHHLNFIMIVGLGAATILSTAKPVNGQAPTHIRLVSQSKQPAKMRLPALQPLSKSSYKKPEPSSEPNHSGRIFAGGSTMHSMGQSRDWGVSDFHWKPTALQHRPLYFEDRNLERHGLTFGVFQPAVSAGHALTRVAALPYMMTRTPPCRPIYTLGYQRPGAPVRYRTYGLPDDPRAALVESAAIVGSVLIIP